MLTAIELSFFARNGFLLVRGVVPALACRHLVDSTWRKLPDTWSPAQPQSWRGEVTDSCHVSTVQARRGHMKFQRGDLLNDPMVETTFGRGSAAETVAAALMGHPLAPMRVRGLYAIAPLAEPPIKWPIDKPHIEAHAVNIVAIAYLADVEPAGGGLLVWPGSHRDVYPEMESKMEYVPRATFDAVYRRWAERRPVEVPGRAGDLLLVHHRLLHAPAINMSRSIRFAFFCDYNHADFRDLCGQAPSVDLWEDWPSITALPEDQREGPSDELPTVGEPRLPDLAPRAPEVNRPNLVPAEGRAPAEATVASLAAPAQPPKRDPSVIRKQDASHLVRSRRPGDRWLVVSDDRRSLKQNFLNPLGSDLQAAGVSVTLDDVPLKSESRHDLICKLPKSDLPTKVQISGIDRPLYVTVIEMRLPFNESIVLSRHDFVAHHETGEVAVPAGVAA